MRRGWAPSYPETTGYIIPTLFNYARTYQDESVRRRAVQMADWLVEIQVDCGGIQAGTVAHQPAVPTIFNTGQALFGWVRAYEETQQEEYFRAAVRAAGWLVKMQDPDGAWRKGESPWVSYPVNTYNTRTAWALWRAFEITGSESCKEACLRNIQWALTQQTETGWFARNCLSDETIPLTHTIAYAIRGILESGISSNESGFVEAAKKAADRLLGAQRENGSLSGRYSEDWAPQAPWSCLTGNLQAAIIWGRLYQLSGDGKYLAAARRANQFVKARVDLTSPENGIRGGVSGSWPLWGTYGRFEYLNWAAKFCVDALMLENALGAEGDPRHARLALSG